MSPAELTGLIVASITALLCFVALGRLMHARATPPAPVPRPHRSWRRFVENAASGQVRSPLYMGQLRSGRRARARIDGGRIRLAVKTDRELPSLRVRLEGAVDRARRALLGQGAMGEVVTGDAAFDAAFFLGTGDPADAGRLLKEDLRRSIDLAFARLRLERLTLEHGELSAEAAIADLPPERWQEALVFLDRVSTLVETKPLKVRCLGEERVAVSDGAGGTRCAYCRDGVSGDEEGLVACDRCRTVVHDACWSEHGACPVLGCAGGQAERARAR